MIIETRDIKRFFTMGSSTVEALKGINFSVKAGEFIAIMGPSGSGKTTLMNIIGCLDSPSSGEYFLNGNLVNDLDEDQLALIRNKEISKEEAVEQIKKPLYLDNEEKIMINYICKKFEFSEDVFQKIINEKPVSHSKFKSQVKYYKILRYIREKLVNSFIWKILKKIKVKI